MKKLILVIISALIMTVFIAFNYLLWDREKIVGMDADKMASIDALSKQIRNFDEEIKLLRLKSQDQDEGIRSLQDKLNQSESERSNLKEKVLQQGELIGFIKQSANLKPLEAVVRKWAESIDNGQYDAAYGLQSRQYMKQDNIEFVNSYRTSVKSMKIKSLSLALEGIPSERHGEVIFKTVLEVKKNENSGKISLVDGNNERFFVIGWDQYNKDWVITDIFVIQ